MKNGLLQVYNADVEAEEFESPNQSSGDKASILTNWEELHKKVGSLEEENLRLRIEATTRANDIELEERKELQLIHDCAKQLSETSISYIMNLFKLVFQSIYMNPIHLIHYSNS